MYIQVFIVDDHEILREGLKSIINKEPDMEVVGEAESGSVALAKIHEYDFDIIIIDVEMPGLSGADTAKKIVSDYGFKNLGGQQSHQSKWKRSVLEVYQDASVSFDWTPILKEECGKVGIDYFSSPYDFEAIDYLDEFMLAW